MEVEIGEDELETQHLSNNDCRRTPFHGLYPAWSTSSKVIYLMGIKVLRVMKSSNPSWAERRGGRMGVTWWVHNHAIIVPNKHLLS